MGGLDRDREGHRSRADVPPSKKEVCRRPAIRLISKKMGCCLPPKGFPLKRTRHKRCAMRLPRKVFAVDGLQFASLEKFLLLTACNSLSSKSFCCRRLAIGFPQKVRAVDGLQWASPKKFLLLTACNGLPLKSFYCRRPAIGFP